MGRIVIVVGAGTGAGLARELAAQLSHHEVEVVALTGEPMHIDMPKERYGIVSAQSYGRLVSMHADERQRGVAVTQSERGEAMAALVGELASRINLSQEELRRVEQQLEQFVQRIDGGLKEAMEIFQSRTVQGDMILREGWKKPIARQRGHVYSSTRSRSGRAARWS